MKRVIFIILLLMFAKFGAKAQTRGYSDNASGTFVVGLDSYFYGASGSLDFELGAECRHKLITPPKGFYFYGKDP